jgi:hypothetical protein
MTTDELCAKLSRPEMEPVAYLVRYIIDVTAERDALAANLAALRDNWPVPPEAVALRAALREAFDAGCEQGSEEATSWEWGCFPRTNRDEAFGDLFETWNASSNPAIASLALATPVQQEPGDGAS